MQLEKVVRSNAVAVEVVVISAEDIDSLRNAMTLNDLEVHGFTKVIEKLPSGICYVDAADVNESHFGRKIQGGLSSARRLVSRHKADDIYPVSKPPCRSPRRSSSKSCCPWHHNTFHLSSWQYL